jgi:hypothetical protein
MAITLVKTWASVRLSPFVGTTAPTIGDVWARTFIGVKNAMVATGYWSVVASSNRVSVGLLTDYLQVPADIYCAAAGTAHSWIVLKNPAIAPDFAVCFEWINTTATNKQYMCAYVTHQGYNSNGMLTTRPTAVGSEQTLLTNLDYCNVTTSTLSAIVLTSSDGECTRVLFHNSTGSFVGSCGPWFFEKLQDPTPWLTVPYIVIMYPSGTTGTVWNWMGTDTHGGRIPDSYYWCSTPTALGVARCYHGAALPVSMMSPLQSNSILGNRVFHDGSICVSQVIPYSRHATVLGILGQMFDLYFISYVFRDRSGTGGGLTNQGSLAPYFYVPSTLSDMGLFTHGDLLLGSDGTSMVFNG